MITEKIKRDLQSVTNNFEKRTCVWSSGVDPVLFDPENVGNPKNEPALKERFVIMYHGIFSSNRGLQQAIKAISIVRKSDPNVLLFLLGQGPGQAEFEDLIRDLRIEDHVVIHPPVIHEEVPKYLKLSKVGILPFPDLDWWNTSSPIKLMEYLAMGKPVIVTDIEAHRKVLGKLKCGFFVRDHEPDSLARGIIEVMEKSFELPTLGKLARKAAIENLTWERQARKIRAFFYDLLKEDKQISF
jgi:glycosyltransferase involved in cell wall biosynthesis